jgi:preprotein translocase subunit SecE
MEQCWPKKRRLNHDFVSLTYVFAPVVDRGQSGLLGATFPSANEELHMYVFVLVVLYIMNASCGNRK